MYANSMGMIVYWVPNPFAGDKNERAVESHS